MINSNVQLINNLGDTSESVRLGVFSKDLDFEFFKEAIYIVQDTDTKVFAALVKQLPVELISDAVTWFSEPTNSVSFGVFSMLALDSISEKDFESILKLVTKSNINLYLGAFYRFPIVKFKYISKLTDRLLKIGFKYFDKIRDEETKVRLGLGLNDLDLEKNRHELKRAVRILLNSFNLDDGVDKIEHKFLDYVCCTTLSNKLDDTELPTTLPKGIRFEIK